MYTELPDAGERQRVAAALGIAAADIIDIVPNPTSGINNSTFIFRLADGRQCLFRRPGVGTERFTSRENEYAAYRALAPYDLTDTLIRYDTALGEKLTEYWPGSHTCDPHNETELRAVTAILHRLHGCGARLPGIDSPAGRLRDYSALAARLGSTRAEHSDWQALRACFLSYRFPKTERCPIHGDCLAGNLLFRPDGELRLIDLEFAAMGDPLSDLADLCHDADLTPEESFGVLALYDGGAPEHTRRRDFSAMCVGIALMWSAWADCKAHTDTERPGFYEDYREMGLRFAERMARAVQL